MLSQTNISWTQNRKIQQNLRNLRHLLSSASVKSWVKFSVLPRSVTHGICIYASLFSLKKALFKNHSFLGVDWLNESIQPGHSASIAYKGYQRLWDEFSWHFPPFFVWHVLTQATANLGWVPCIFKPQFRIESVCFRKGFQEILGRGTFQTLPLLVFWPGERERETANFHYSFSFAFWVSNRNRFLLGNFERWKRKSPSGLGWMLLSATTESGNLVEPEGH